MSKLIRSAYDGLRKRVSLSFLDEDGNPDVGRTKQSCKDECDIGRILRRYDRDGVITHINQCQAQYGDYTEVDEYRVHLDAVRQAEQAFADLPAIVRRRFENDPGEFFEFITNPANAKEMVDLGLAEVVPKPPEKGREPEPKGDGDNPDQ